VEKEKIREVLIAKDNKLKKSCKDLVKMALGAGSDDLITVVLVKGNRDVRSAAYQVSVQCDNRISATGKLTGQIQNKRSKKIPDKIVLRFLIFWDRKKDFIFKLTD
jgi:serine/threonine protein phosphatase PrpC